MRLLQNVQEQNLISLFVCPVRSTQLENSWTICDMWNLCHLRQRHKFLSSNFSQPVIRIWQEQQLRKM